MVSGAGEEQPIRDLAGKVAVITGAGSGFGREFARIAARERMKLLLADVQQDALDEAVAEARGSGAQALGVRADVSNAARCSSLRPRRWGSSAPRTFSSTTQAWRRAAASNTVLSGLRSNLEVPG